MRHTEYKFQTLVTAIFAAAILIPQTAAAVSFTYDPLHRLKSADYGNGLSITYEYDASGNRSSRVVASNYRSITVEIPTAGGTVTGAGIVTVGEIVTLQASPAHHKRFDLWKEGATNLGTSPLLSFTVTDSRTLQAYFSQLDPFDAYVTDFGLDPAGNGAPLANPTGDGIPNLMKFALGGNPTVADASILPAPGMGSVGGSPVFVFDFYFSVSAAQSVTMTTEYSTDLVNWTDAVAGQGGVTVVTTPVGADRSRTTVTIPSPASRLFARLRVTRPLPVAP